MAKQKNLPKRNEVDQQYKWAIEDLYPSDEDWQKEYDSLINMLPK